MGDYPVADLNESATTRARRDAKNIYTNNVPFFIAWGVLSAAIGGFAMWWIGLAVFASLLLGVYLATSWNAPRRQRNDAREYLEGEAGRLRAAKEPLERRIAELLQPMTAKSNLEGHRMSLMLLARKYRLWVAERDSSPIDVGHFTGKIEGAFENIQGTINELGLDSDGPFDKRFDLVNEPPTDDQVLGLIDVATQELERLKESVD